MPNVYPEDSVLKVHVYQYGLQPPTQGLREIRNQFYLSHRYANELIEIERRRQERLAAIQEARFPQLGTFDAAFKQIAKATKPLKERIKHLEFYSEPVADELRRELQTLQAQHAQLTAQAKAARNAFEADPEVQTVNTEAALERGTQNLPGGARKNSGVYWGTQQLVEAAVQAAIQDSHPDPPSWRSWSREGQIGIQIQAAQPLFGRDLAGPDTRLRVVPVPDRLAHKRKKFRGGFAELWFRVGSEKRKPVWAVFPMRLHRSIPLHARILKATVSMRLEGTRERWTCSITVEQPIKKPSMGKKAIAVDVRWRKLPSGQLCAGYWVDTDGNSGELIVDPRVISGVEKSNSLQEIRDRNRNEMCSQLAAWFRPLRRKRKLPEEVLKRTRTLGKWESSRRFIGFYHWWKRHRFEGDNAGFAILDAWWSREYHLYDWEAAQRRKSQGRRNDAYYVFAANAAKNYDHVIVEKFDKRTFATKKKRAVKKDEKAEKERQAKDKIEHAQRINQRTAAPSILVNSLKRAAHTHGANFWEIPCAGTTIDCHVCGKRDKWDPKASLEHQCSECGTVWDQRENAALNLIKRWREDPDLEPVVQKRKKGGRFANRHKKGKGKETVPKEA